MKMTDHDFFPGFAWAVPRAFADPLSACRFELGDTLYSRPEAYTEAWDSAGSRARAVQVLEPVKGLGSGGGGTGAESSTLEEAWRQEVLFELHDLSTGTMRQVRATQGRLYCLLWKDDETVLDPARPAPAAPLNAGAFKKYLDVAAAKLPAAGSPRFLLATDIAADAQREKLRKVRIALREAFDVEPKLLAAQKLGLDAEFLPTVHLAIFALEPGASETAVTKVLKNALYKPTTGSGTGRDRFRLAGHGLLIGAAAD
ncbi:hypothetical protein CSB20_06995 [bacterium DOLZORAL124_64_63]|nr:MAG: hypothetical protein CSB20_06995 [bacterium DOLZORAL124_64_63]